MRGAFAGVLAASLLKRDSIVSTAQTPEASPEQCLTTTPEENAALIQDRYWAEIFMAGGDAAVPDLLLPDEIHHWGAFNDTVGTDAYIERLTTFLTAFPTIKSWSTMSWRKATWLLPATRQPARTRANGRGWPPRDAVHVHRHEYVPLPAARSPRVGAPRITLGCCVRSAEKSRLATPVSG